MLLACAVSRDVRAKEKRPPCDGRRITSMPVEPMLIRLMLIRLMLIRLMPLRDH